MRAKTLWIKDEYLQLILDGRKTVEVRVGYSNITRLQGGDRLMLNGQHAYVIRRIGRCAGSRRPGFDCPRCPGEQASRNAAGDLSP